MDYVTRQFVVLAKKLRKELREALSDLNSALHKQTEAIRKSNERRDNEERPSPEVVTNVNLPESIEVHQGQADTKAERNYRFRTLLVSWVTFLAIAVYAVLVYLQYQEMINATGVAQQTVTEARRNRLQADKAFAAAVAQFRLDQRAWVGVVSMDPPDLKPKSEFFLTLHVVNSGHTPALNFHSETVLHSLAKEEVFKPVYGAVLEIPSRGVIQPGEVIHLLTNKFPITQPQIDWVRNGRYILYVYGRMSYDDVFKVTHHTTFCKEILSESQVKTCGTYNTAD
jgi:hypothetical protein